jgi:hypothetical protein
LLIAFRCLITRNSYIRFVTYKLLLAVRKTVYFGLNLVRKISKPIAHHFLDNLVKEKECGEDLKSERLLLVVFDYCRICNCSAKYRYVKTMHVPYSQSASQIAHYSLRIAHFIFHISYFILHISHCK